MGMSTRDATLAEWMDVETLAPQQLSRCLADLRHINTLLGWTRLAVQGVARAVRESGQGSFSLLDVACGSGDMASAIARWAARQGIEARIVATDLHPATVALARQQTAHISSISVERQDALALPYEPGSFDIALCTLALHHFAPAAAVQVLAGMARVGRRVLVYDLVRSHAAYVGALALTRAGAMDAITRHDAPASVRRAYRAEELRALATRAGLTSAHVGVAFPFRLVLDAPGSAPTPQPPTSGGARL